MKKNVWIVLIFLAVCVSGQSYICSRTATVDTYCNDDGTRTAILYPSQVNVLTENGYEPFEDVATLEYRDGYFEFSYFNQVAKIELFAVVNSIEIDPKEINLMVDPIIRKHRGMFEYGVSLDGADKIEAFGFRIAGDEIKDVKYDFSDANTEKTAVERKDAKTAIVRILDSSTKLVIDPTIYVNSTMADAEVRAGAPDSNFGTSTLLGVMLNGGTINHTFMKFNLTDLPPDSMIDISSAYLYYCITNSGNTLGHSDIYNTTTDWAETTITYNNAPAPDTLQTTITNTGCMSSADVLPAVQAASKQSNRLVSLRFSYSGTGGSNAWYLIASKEYATAEYHPYLNITYTFTITPEPETGLVGYWKFNEGAGSATFDYSGYGNYGLISGANWTNSKYRMNYSLTYDGVNNNVNTGNASILNPAQNMTAMAWVYINTTFPSARWYYIMTKGVTQLEFGYSGWGDTWVFKPYNSSNSALTCSYKHSPQLYTWYHIAGTVNSTHTALYLNGVQVALCPVVNTGLKTSTASLTIGGDGAGKGIKSQIDEVKIYNRTLSDSEILAEYLKNGCFYDMNIAAFNESNLNQQIYFNLVLSNSSTSETFSNVWNWTANEYCNGSTPSGSVTVSVSNNSFYSPRYRYVNTADYPNVTMYLLPLDSPTTILTTFTVLYGASPIQNALIKIQRFINNNWVTIAEGMTDVSGSSGFILDYSQQYYIITNASGYIPRYDYLMPTRTQYYFLLQYGAGGSEFWQYYGKVAYDCEVDNSSFPTVTITCWVNDASNLMKYARLEVKKVGILGATQICNITNDTIPDVTLFCTVENANNTHIVYSLIAHFQDEHLLIQRIVDFLQPPALKLIGAFPALLLTLTLALAFIWSPVFVPIGAGIGITASALLGLISVPIDVLFALAIMLAVYLYLLKT